MAKDKSLGRGIISLFNILLWLFFLILLIIAFTPLTNYMLKPLIVKEDIRNGDVIVVLAAGINEGRYQSLGSSHRMVRGVQLYYDGKAKKILFSGGIPKGMNVAEATVMGQEARRLKVPAEDIILEKISKRTYDHAVQIKKIADPLKYKSLILVTSWVHMKRSLMVFEQAGFKVYPAPADPIELYMGDPLARLGLCQQVIHEYLGVIYYRIRGWI